MKFNKTMASILSIFILLYILPFASLIVGAATEGYYTYIVFNKQSHITNSSFSSTFGGGLNIPSHLGGYDVTKIDYRAFKDQHLIKSLFIPYSIKRIESYAFENCYNLNRMQMVYGIESIGDYTFNNCHSLTNIYLPNSLKYIGNNAFANCSNIENICYTGSPDEWKEITILSGNEYFKNATIYYNSTVIPSRVSLIEISKSPDKVQYIENEEELDLTGGVLTVNYDGGAKQEIDLATLSVEGFDNTILGKQTITIKYGEFLTEFEIEIIPRPISFIAISSFPNNREYILGESLDLTGGKIAVGYPEGNYEIFDLTEDMVSGWDMKKSGYQILNITHKGHTTEFAIRIFKSGDINGDDNVNATDTILLITNLLNNYESKTKYDINQDGVLDIRDLVGLKNKLAGIIA